MKPSAFFLVVFCLISFRHAYSQFTADWLRNDRYWNDGKAEFNIYDAKIVRYGEPRRCEVIHILVREPFDPEQGVKPDDWQKPGTIQVLKLNQILHVPTGIYVYQQMHSAFWKIDSGELLKWSLTSNDSCGNTFKTASRLASIVTPRAAQVAGAELPVHVPGWKYCYATYWDGMAIGTAGFDLPVAAEGNVEQPAVFYDELPMRVRTIDFAKRAAGEFAIQLAGSVINSKRDTIAFVPAKVHYETTADGITVSVTAEKRRDTFVLDAKFPHPLREWKQGDGSELKLKRSLKIDYWNYNKPGDEERALADPALSNGL